MPLLIPVVLSGGSGNRLWPLSTPARPKQFADLMDGPTLFESTIDRLSGLADVDSLVVVTGRAHLGQVTAITERLLVGSQVIVEPVGRNTAPAAAAAALQMGSEDVMLVVPSDHLVSDVGAFHTAVGEAVTLALGGHLVAMGVVPHRAETGFGYIEVGDPIPGGNRIARFVEKPTLESAERLVADGGHLWNAGMFVTPAGLFLDELESHQPGLVDAVRKAMPSNLVSPAHLAESFSDVEPISIDYGVMEHTSVGAVVPLDAGWSDVGSYASLLEAASRDDSGNSSAGDVNLLDVTGSLIRSTSRRVTVVGVNGLAIVETPEEVLVVSLGQSQRVREIAEPVHPD